MSLSRHSFPEAAQDLAQARIQLNPRLRRRIPAHELERLYERRSTHKQLQRLLKQLEDAVRPGSSQLHVLYVGPSGCGKSMDLSWLAKTIASTPGLDRCVSCIHFGIGEQIGLHEVTFSELALAFTLQLRDAAPEVITEADLHSVVQWLYGEQTEERIEEVGKSSGLSASLIGLISGALTARVTRKDTTRLRLTRRLPELQQILRGLIEKFTEKKGKRPLFIVDDLEKITPVNEAMNLFLDQGGFFSALPCHLILTAPNALTLESRYTREVLNHFQEYRVILPWPGSEEEPTAEVGVLQRIIDRRVAPSLIDDDAMLHAILQTGGVVAQLIEVMQRAALEAELEEQQAAHRTQVDAALRELQTRYSSMLKYADFPTLERIGERGLPSDVDRPNLMHNLSVLEHPDSPTWIRVHPVVLPLVTRWRTYEDRRH